MIIGGRIFIITAIMGAAFAVCAQAENAPQAIDVDGVAVNVTLPDGACLYDRSNPYDAQVMDMLERGNKNYNRVLLAFADCNDLKLMHSGKMSPPQGDYGQILSPLQGPPDVQNHSRVELVGSITDYYRQNVGIFDEGSKLAKDIMKSVSNDAVKLGENKMLGIIKTDPDFVQVGMIQTLQQEGLSLRLAGVVTTTKLGRMVTINLYHPYTDESSIGTLSKQAEDYTRKLIALNPDTAAGSAGTGWNWHDAALMGIIGAIAGGAIATVSRLVKRRRQ